MLFIQTYLVNYITNGTGLLNQRCIRPLPNVILYLRSRSSNGILYKLHEMNMLCTYISFDNFQTLVKLNLWTGLRLSTASPSKWAVLLYSYVCYFYPFRTVPSMPMRPVLLGQFTF